MPTAIAAKRLGINPRTAQKLWNSAIMKIGGDIFIRQPVTCEIVLHHVYAVDASEHDPLQPQSIECLVASGRYIPNL
jgi:hypothetical protein